MVSKETNVTKPVWAQWRYRGTPGRWHVIAEEGEFRGIVDGVKVAMAGVRTACGETRTAPPVTRPTVGAPACPACVTLDVMRRSYAADRAGQRELSPVPVRRGQAT
jgi:uncharacterized cupin superfamily protein